MSLLLLIPLVSALAGCAGPSLTCTEVPAAGDGLTISRGLIAGTMHISCTTLPDTYDVTVVLVRDGVALKPGVARSDLPTVTGYNVSTFNECEPGTWHIYYLVTLTYDGQTAHNTNTTTPDRTVTSGDCAVSEG